MTGTKSVNLFTVEGFGNIKHDKYQSAESYPTGLGTTQFPDDCDVCPIRARAPCKEED